MGGNRLIRVMLLALTVAIGACGNVETTETTGPPPPATETEMEAFCEKYETVRNQSWGELTAALIEVSPAEIEAQMVRSSQPPGESWAEDRDAVEAYLDRCDEP